MSSQTRRAPGRQRSKAHALSRGAACGGNVQRGSSNPPHAEPAWSVIMSPRDWLAGVCLVVHGRERIRASKATAAVEDIIFDLGGRLVPNRARPSCKIYVIALGNRRKQCRPRPGGTSLGARLWCYSTRVVFKPQMQQLVIPVGWRQVGGTRSDGRVTCTHMQGRARNAAGDTAG